MERVWGVLVVLGPVGLLAAGAIPSAWANRHVANMRRLVFGTVAGALACALAAGALLALTGPPDVSPTHRPLDVLGARSGEFVPAGSSAPLEASATVFDRVCLDHLYFDSLSAVMLLLVSFLGLIVVRFSLRYLDGDPAQGRFLRWISFTLGAVLLLIVAGNLLLFVGAWIMTSFGLHQLLTHYSERPGAVLAARKKFLISRLGDLFLAGALALTYQTFGTFDFGRLFTAAQAMLAEGDKFGWSLSAIGTLFVLGAMTKSAQFPFHSWLPDTMETPTPVSALMHAGIINAGGFLVIRLSPLIANSHLPLDLLAAVGAVTALFGALSMLAQTSVKRSLAYSTIAQMGFMMLQCGLGAFSAALLHIVAHSLYKAHAFLRSGSVLENAARLDSPKPSPTSLARSLGLLTVAGVLAASIGLVVLWGSGVMYFAKPGAMLLTFVMTLALTYLLWKSLMTGRWQVVASGIAAAFGLCVSYGVAYTITDRLLSTSVSRGVAPQTAIDVGLMIAAAVGFAALFALQYAVTLGLRRPWLNRLYVSAANGFYVDIAAHKLTLTLTSFGRSPVLGTTHSESAR